MKCVIKSWFGGSSLVPYRNTISPGQYCITWFLAWPLTESLNALYFLLWTSIYCIPSSCALCGVKINLNFTVLFSKDFLFKPVYSLNGILCLKPKETIYLACLFLLFLSLTLKANGSKRLLCSSVCTKYSCIWACSRQLLVNFPSYWECKASQWTLTAQTQLDYNDGHASGCMYTVPPSSFTAFNTFRSMYR